MEIPSCPLPGVCRGPADQIRVPRGSPGTAPPCPLATASIRPGIDSSVGVGRDCRRIARLLDGVKVAHKRRSTARDRRLAAELPYETCRLPFPYRTVVELRTHAEPNTAARRK